MDISSLSLEKKKEIYNRLLDIFGIKRYEIDNLSVRNGKVVKYSRGYGPYDDEWDEVHANKTHANVIEKYRLMLDLNQIIKNETDQNYYNLNNTIDKLASEYSKDDLRMD